MRLGKFTLPDFGTEVVDLSENLEERIIEDLGDDGASRLFEDGSELDHLYSTQSRAKDVLVARLAGG